jgi:hypothetical protein
MKTKAILFVIALLFTSITSQANTNTETNNKDTAKHRIDIRVNQDYLVVLRADCFKGEKRLNYVLKVYAENGDMVFASSFYKKGPIYRMYDMSNLPKGKYTFKITKWFKEVYSKDIMKNCNPDATSNEKPMIVELK